MCGVWCKSDAISMIYESIRNWGVEHNWSCRGGSGSAICYMIYVWKLDAHLVVLCEMVFDWMLMEEINIKVLFLQYRVLTVTIISNKIVFV